MSKFDLNVVKNLVTCEDHDGLDRYFAGRPDDFFPRFSLNPWPDLYERFPLLWDLDGQSLGSVNDPIMVEVTDIVGFSLPCDDTLYHGFRVDWNRVKNILRFCYGYMGYSRDTVPPIHVTAIKTKTKTEIFLQSDGRHRVYAALLLGLPRLRAFGTLYDYSTV